MKTPKLTAAQIDRINNFVILWEEGSVSEDWITSKLNSDELAFFDMAMENRAA